MRNWSIYVTTTSFHCVVLWLLIYIVNIASRYHFWAHTVFMLAVFKSMTFLYFSVWWFCCWEVKVGGFFIVYYILYLPQCWKNLIGLYMAEMPVVCLAFIPVYKLTLFHLITDVGIHGYLVVWLLADCEGTELLERKTEDNSPRCETKQHSVRQTRQHQALWLWYLWSASG